MIPDFLCRKIKCFYCNNKIKCKDAVALKVVIQGEVKEFHWICSRCSNTIQRIKDERDKKRIEKNYLSQFLKPKWAIKQIIRYDRGDLVEDICEHGIGHPNKEWYFRYGKDGDTIHGCDGCCCEEKIKKKSKSKKILKKTSKKTTKKKKKDKIYSAEPLKIVKL